MNSQATHKNFDKDDSLTAHSKAYHSSYISSSSQIGTSAVQQTISIEGTGPKMTNFNTVSKNGLISSEY